MKLIGLMPVRNEAWCLGLTLRAALMWCDEVICADHGSTDESRYIMHEVARETGRVIIRDDREQQWREMEQRQMLLEEARELGATHIAIVDADEIVTGNLHNDDPSSLIRHLVECTPQGSCLQLPMYQLRGSLDRYHSNGIWGNRWLSVAFKDDPKLSWSGDKFHDREPRYDGGGKLRPYQPIHQGQGGSFHLWGVSERRLAAKHALYKVTERLRFPAKPTVEIERMYNLWRSPEDSAVLYPAQRDWARPWTFAPVPREWWDPYRSELLDHLDPVDLSEPWQTVEVRRLVAEHSAERFKGLDLFGVDMNTKCEACGHVEDEHGGDPEFPGSTACNVDECDCISFEDSGEEQD